MDEDEDNHRWCCGDLFRDHRQCLRRPQHVVIFRLRTDHLTGRTSHTQMGALVALATKHQKHVLQECPPYRDGRHQSWSEEMESLQIEM